MARPSSVASGFPFAATWRRSGRSRGAGGGARAQERKEEMLDFHDDARGNHTLTLAVRTRAHRLAAATQRRPPTEAQPCRPQHTAAGSVFGPAAQVAGWRPSRQPCSHAERCSARGPKLCRCPRHCQEVSLCCCCPCTGRGRVRQQGARAARVRLHLPCEMRGEAATRRAWAALPEAPAGASGALAAAAVTLGAACALRSGASRAGGRGTRASAAFALFCTRLRALALTRPK